ncbi:O-methyltransferase [Curvibacter gracilis]|uniref:O-methyltransferase n=1 Tax=Curvibacter gracilis TaxID=230310 RepID=UPI0004854EE2|nr:O-methyltransferase [Curvibacter gracilis]
MSAGSSLPYRLRPNKAVDRELFLSLLMRLAPKLALETYHYVGLGGPFLEDFRLIHARLGIAKMTCIETEEQVHKRQLFNRPIASIECVHKSLEDYLDETDLDSPAIIWFDYAEPKSITSQIERFARTIGTVPIGSVLRITLNANPSSLGRPDGNLSEAELMGWRLQAFQRRLGALFPNGLIADGMKQENFGKSLLHALKLAVEKEVLSFRDRRIVWALATHYADGQAMVTAALVVCQNNDKIIEDVVKAWEFHATTDAPHRVDLPALSTLERLTMESSDDAQAKMGFELPMSNMGENPFDVFKKFYRIYPHFSRVEL